MIVIEYIYTEKKITRRGMGLFHNTFRSEASDCSIISRRCFNLIFNERVKELFSRNEE